MYVCTSVLNIVCSDLKKALRSQIGPFATPDVVCFHDLPKTRSGKASIVAMMR
jgi:acyl-coenzyme A synthetase/AMP-(fatty) acid ligase